MIANFAIIWHNKVDKTKKLRFFGKLCELKWTRDNYYPWSIFVGNSSGGATASIG